MTTLEKALTQYILDKDGKVATSIRTIDFEVDVELYGGCGSCGDIEKSATLDIQYSTEESNYNYLTIDEYNIEDFLSDLVNITRDITLRNLGLETLPEDSDG